MYLQLPFQRKVRLLNIDTWGEPSVDPYEIGWRVSLKANYLYRNAHEAHENTQRQLTDDSFEPKWPETLIFLFDPHKLDRPDNLNPNVLKQGVLVTEDSENDSRYPDTRATNPQFRDFPDASMSGSTGHENKPSPRGTLEDPDSSPLVFNLRIRYIEILYVSNDSTKMVDRPRIDSIGPKSVKMGALVDMTRNNLPQDVHKILTEPNDTGVHTNHFLKKFSQHKYSPQVEVRVSQETMMSHDNPNGPSIALRYHDEDTDDTPTRMSHRTLKVVDSCGEMYVRSERLSKATD